MKTSQTIMYNLLQFFLIATLLPVWLPFALIHKKRKQTFLKRLGFQTIKSEKKLNSPIWIHALSVGEVLSALPLIRAMHNRWPDQEIIFSASTLTGYDMAQNIKSCVTEIIYYPYDLLFSVRRMIKKIHPRLFVLVESDIWPNFLTHIHHKKIPCVLVNARLSPESYRGYRLLKYFMEPALNTFTRICVQSDIQAKRFQSFGLEPVRIAVTGNVKYDQDQHQLSPDERQQLYIDLNISEDSPVIIAGSTHEGEETILAEIFSRLKKKQPDLKMIVAPRDPVRANDLHEIFHRYALSTTTFSQKQFKDKDVLIVDQMGVLGKLYGICKIAFVGGSLVTEGGHNPLEPAAMEKPVVFGSDMHDFPEISNQLIQKGAAFQVKDASELYTIFQHLLNDTHAAKRCGQRAKAFVRDNQGAVDKTLNFL
ncbi:MAG: 3-deoxy-D-manno-octulosonic acid transferase [Candidatus Magnetomorum sp.]|nr:3-deoxy-D-manno-octulosonic acid transferase [Candidatus Magnetomorum sp.]